MENIEDDENGASVSTEDAPNGTDRLVRLYNRKVLKKTMNAITSVVSAVDKQSENFTRAFKEQKETHEEELNSKKEL